MSKYTTTVRDICNEILLRDEAIIMPSSNMGVYEILIKTWDKIFDPTAFVFWRPELKGMFCTDILRHYYTREIGFETVGLWKLKLNTRMREIMPYYNQLFETTAIEYDPFNDTDYTRTVEGKESGENNRAENTDRNGEGSSGESYNSNKKENGNNKNVNKFSDTPQGGLIGVENDNYLTNVTIDTGEGENNSDISGVRNANNSNKESISLIGTGAFANSNNLVEHIVGKRSGISYSKAMMEYRDSLINVELMVFDELRDLFMLLW